LLPPAPPRRSRHLRRVLGAVGLGMVLCLTTACHAAAAAPTMVSIFQDDPHLEANPAAVLQQMRLAGATTVKVGLMWDKIAPDPNQRRAPKGFNAADPYEYPSGSWTIYVEIVRHAAADGIAVDVQLGDGAPAWATGPGAPNPTKPHPNWEPSPSAFQAFVRAAGIRYSGHFRPKGASTPLPRVSFWSVWNEPNLGFELAPQGVPGHVGIQNSGRLYRGLLNAAWNALHQTGHGNDTILIGEIAPRGATNFGFFAAMKPLIFMEALYCVDSSFHQLRGTAAAERGCPTTAAGSRLFQKQNPALFSASGLGLHLWARWYPPNVDPQHDPNYAGFPDLPHFERAIDAMQRAYGSRKQFGLYNTEFGYITDPPNPDAGYPTHPFPSPTTAAYYLNWAEYISWSNPRMRSFAQYVLQDLAPPVTGPYEFWSAGLFSYTGRPKVTYSAWRLPVYLPVTSTTSGHSLLVWGCARPATFAMADTKQAPPVAIQFEPSSGSTYTTLSTVTIHSRSSCYFDVHQTFPSSGTVRLAWQYPLMDPLLGDFSARTATVYSRPVQVTIK
jgi:hypothetical protein